MYCKATRINMGRTSLILKSYSETPIAWCRRNFGPGGTQAGRRWWFNRIQTADHFYEIIMYFRDPHDATIFSLKYHAERL